MSTFNKILVYSLVQFFLVAVGIVSYFQFDGFYSVLGITFSSFMSVGVLIATIVQQEEDKKKALKKKLNQS